MRNWIINNPILFSLIVVAALVGVYFLFFRKKPTKSTGDVKVSDLIPTTTETTVNTVPNFVPNNNAVPAVQAGSMSSSGGAMSGGGRAGAGAGARAGAGAGKGTR